MLDFRTKANTLRSLEGRLTAARQALSFSAGRSRWRLR